VPSRRRLSQSLAGTLKITFLPLDPLEAAVLLEPGAGDSVDEDAALARGEDPVAVAVAVPRVPAVLLLAAAVRAGASLPASVREWAAADLAVAGYAVMILIMFRIVLPGLGRITA
jgi:hypothetical protein